MHHICTAYSYAQPRHCTRTAHALHVHRTRTSYAPHTQAQLFLSPRLTLTLTTSGNTGDVERLHDDAALEPYASDGAEQLRLSAAPRPLSDFAPGAAGAVPLQQIRVRSAQRGQAYGAAMVIKPVGPDTTVAQVKAMLISAKQFSGMPADPNKLTLYFSPVFITPDVLLSRKQRAVPMDTDSLSACQARPPTPRPATSRRAACRTAPLAALRRAQPHTHPHATCAGCARRHHVPRVS